MKSDIYILNPNYMLIPDKRRVALIEDDGKRFRFHYIHPMHAVMLSFFTGSKDIESVIRDIATFFSIETDSAFKIISTFIENEKEVNIEYGGHIFFFPKRVLIKNQKASVRKDLITENYMLNGPYDFKTLRLYVPKNIVFIINMTCATDCIYCYANRKHKFNPMSTEKILSIIREAREIGIRHFDISGGELFLHKDWKKIVKTLTDNGYNPDPSTKVPLSKDDIDAIYNLGIRHLQVSLDSLNPEIQQNNIKVPHSYIDRMKESLKYMDDKGIEITIKGTQTIHTCNIENLTEIMNFIKTFKNIRQYTVSTIGKPMYKPELDFKELRPTLQQVSEIETFLQEMESKVSYEILFDNQVIPKSTLCNYMEFKNRSICSGNLDGFVILPDGQVTICEELYWNPNFIIGDLTKQSIMDMWSSDRAVNLWNLKQENIPSDSPCFKCQDFSNCRLGAGVCWKFVIGAYGEDKFMYPDPRCPRAPEPFNDIYYDC